MEQDRSDLDLVFNAEEAVQTQLSAINKRFQDQLEDLESKIKTLGQNILEEDGGDSHPDIKVNTSLSCLKFCNCS